MTKIVTIYGLGTASSLRTTMECTDTVISKSWALAAIYPNEWTPQELDFYTTGLPRESHRTFYAFLESQGYTAEPYSGFDCSTSCVSGANHAIRDVYRFLKKNHPPVNLTISTSWHLEPIFALQSTVLMNYIAWYGLVCLYPQLTLQRRGLINQHEVSTNVTLCLTEYRERGFDLRANVNKWDDTRIHRCAVDTFCPATVGHISSHFVAFAPFDYGNILDDFVFTDIAWTLRIPCYQNFYLYEYP